MVNPKNEIRAFRAANPETYQPQYIPQRSGESLLFLTRLSDVVALDDNTPAIYRGPAPYQGLTIFGPESLPNQILRSLSLRWLLLREFLFSKA